ncbi:MAG: hypothetical protein J7M38_02405, partial [Armatimonadetes bacterium]|nr:hypothetical protein [Armatimonadota bacterium]
MKRLAALALFLGLSALWTWAAPLDIPRADAPPVLDGKFDDACWRQATALDDFHVLGSDEEPAAGTVARLCHDGVWLYIGFECKDPNPESLVAERFDRDGPVNLDDSVEVFISPHPTGIIYYHFLLSVTNMRAEQQGRPGTTPRRSWDGGWRSATAVGPDGWRAEIAIPLAVLGSGSGDHWLLNLCRNKRTEPAQYISLAPVERTFKELQHFLPVTPLAIEARPFAPCIRDARVSQYITDGDRFGYKLTLDVSNITGEGGELPLTVTDEPQQGKPTTVQATLKLGPVEEGEVDIFVPVAAPARRTVTVVMT